MSLQNDPFNLLDTDTRVVPFLAKNKLDDMVAHALTQPQEKPHPVTRPAHKFLWSGTGFAVAACLLLLISGSHMAPPDINTTTTTTVVSDVGQIILPTLDETDNDLGDMLVLATLESQ
ncbi:MAG: hypothetical protein AAB276_09570 [Pseudomonadota bacterium]